MDVGLANLVRIRALHRCEYCQFPQGYSPLPHEIDHIIAQKHGGPTSAGNCCLACFACNNHKGPNIAGVDPLTHRIVRLYHPIKHSWRRHFRWSGAVLVGHSPIGRATIAVLQINLPYRVALRQSLMEEGVYFSR